MTQRKGETKSDGSLESMMRGPAMMVLDTDHISILQIGFDADGRVSTQVLKSSFVTCPNTISHSTNSIRGEPACARNCTGKGWTGSSLFIR